MSSQGVVCDCKRIAGTDKFRLFSTFNGKTKTRDANQAEARRFCARNKINFPQ